MWPMGTRDNRPASTTRRTRSRTIERTSPAPSRVRSRPPDRPIADADATNAGRTVEPGRAPDEIPSGADVRSPDESVAARADEGSTARADGGPAATPHPGVAGTADLEPWALPFAAFRAGRGEICPFLRSDVGDEVLDLPLEHPDPANRCTAFGPPVPQSARQQELVCLQTGHLNCPRYLRGELVARKRLPRASRVRNLSRPILAAVAVLVLSSLVAFGFVLRNGGLVTPVPGLAGPNGSDVALAAAGGSSAPSASTTSPTDGASPSPAPTQSPTESFTPGPSLDPSPSPAPSEVATPGPTATSDRYQFLTPCPGTPRCYVYVVRSGDNLYSIAHWFGVPLDTVYRMNPSLRSGGLRAGMHVELPPPTR